MEHNRINLPSLRDREKYDKLLEKLLDNPNRNIRKIRKYLDSGNQYFMERLITKSTEWLPDLAVWAFSTGIGDDSMAKSFVRYGGIPQIMKASHSYLEEDHMIHAWSAEILSDLVLYGHANLVAEAGGVPIIIRAFERNDPSVEDMDVIQDAIETIATEIGHYYIHLFENSKDDFINSLANKIKKGPHAADVAAYYERATRFHEAMKIYESIGLSQDAMRVRASMNKPSNIQQNFHAGNVNLGTMTTYNDSVINRSPIGGSSKKHFSICPYCSQELNFPNTPRFCPYCREQLQH